MSPAALAHHIPPAIPRKWEEELETMEKVIAWLEEGKATTFGIGFVESS